MIALMAMQIGRLAPICQWLPRYQRLWLRLDLIAELTLAACVEGEAARNYHV